MDLEGCPLTQKQFIFQRDIPETSCICEVCENAEMMAKGMRKSKPSHPVNAHDIVERYSCDSDDPDCMKSICPTCQIISSFDASFQSSQSDEESIQSDADSDYVSYGAWVREDKKKKNYQECG